MARIAEALVEASRHADRFAAALGPRVRERAGVLFRLLADHGEVDSRELAAALGLGDPRRIAGAVNTHLKIASRRLGLPLPFDGGSSHAARGGPTTWRDRDGNAAPRGGAAPMSIRGARRLQPRHP